MKGSTIQSKHIGKDIGSSFKTLVGGELQSYTQLLNDARALDTKRMVVEAVELGADAIINIRYSSASVMQGAAEVLAYVPQFDSNKTELSEVSDIRRRGKSSAPCDRKGKPLPPERHESCTAEKVHDWHRCHDRPLYPSGTRAWSYAKGPDAYKPIWLRCDPYYKV